MLRCDIEEDQIFQFNVLLNGLVNYLKQDISQTSEKVFRRDQEI